VEIPFDRSRAASLREYVRVVAESKVPVAADEPTAPAEVSARAVTREDVNKLVGELFSQVTNIASIDADVELTSQGLDSLSGTELISQLETLLQVEIGPEVLFEYPLPDQFVDRVYALTAWGQN
jgi:acyl carrier protein